jgi:hypothetical protein
MAALRRRAAEHPATVLAGAAMLASGVLLLHWLSRVTFWRDEWDFLLHRRSWSPGTFFRPFVEQLVAVSIFVYKALAATWGMESALPYQVIAVFLFVLSVGLLFAYVRLRVGEWLALAAILPILFLGPSWDDLLFPFQMALFGSMACGIGALLALDRRTRRSDALAAALLLLGLLFSDLGVVFVAAATIDLALDRDRRRRAFVVAIPIVLWVLWYLGWGHNAETSISARNFANAPSYVLDGLATSVATLLGLGIPLGDYQASALDWGRPILVALIALASWRIYRLRPPSPRLLAVLVLLIGFWTLTSLNASPVAAPTVGRYQYVGIVLLILVAAELLRGVRVRRPAIACALIVSLAATLTNVDRLREAADGLAGIAQRERGGLAALELTRGRVSPGFELTQQNSGVEYLGFLDAGSYFSAIDAYGSPAYTPAELGTAPELARVSADKVFAAALGVHLAATDEVGRRCHAYAALPNSVTTVPPEGVVLVSRVPGVRVSARRYATQSYPVALGELPVDRPQLLRIEPDRSVRPWVLQFSRPGASVCRP